MKLELLATALSTLLLAGAAHASGYSVSLGTRASVGDVYSAGGGACLYNFSDVGGACSQSTGYYGGTASATVDPLGGDGSATSATSAVMVTGDGASATSQATADLRTGSIHLFGSDSAQTSNCSSQTLPCGGTQERAELQDTLHFNVAGAGPDTVTQITAIFTLHGSMYPVGGNVDLPDSADGELYGALTFGGVPSRFDLQNNYTTGFATVAYLDNYPSGHANTWTTNADHTLNVSEYTFDVTGPAATLPFDLNATLYCNYGFVCDYRDTLQFALLLAPGTTFTSDSGVFLTGTGGVPEPAAWALMLAGFGVIGATARRKRSAVPA